MMFSGKQNIICHYHGIDFQRFTRYEHKGMVTNTSAKVCFFYLFCK